MRYDYKCQDCGYIREFTAGVDQIILSDMYCPSCRLEGDDECVSTFIRTFSPSTNFILKGSGCGWAKNGYNKQPDKKEKGED